MARHFLEWNKDLADYIDTEKFCTVNRPNRYKRLRVAKELSGSPVIQTEGGLISKWVWNHDASIKLGAVHSQQGHDADRIFTNVSSLRASRKFVALAKAASRRNSRVERYGEARPSEAESTP